MSDGWFCKIAGKELGPMSARELKALASQGQLHPSDLVRHGREAAWVPAGRLKGIFSGSALRVGSEPVSGPAPPLPTRDSAPTVPAQPAGALRPAQTPPPLSRSLPAGPSPPDSTAVRDGTTVAGPLPGNPPAPSPPSIGPIAAGERSAQFASGLDFLQEEYAAPAGFKAPRPASPVTDVLEQKRQRERRNLTILAGVAVGLMLVLGVLMTILFLKQHAAAPGAAGQGSASALPAGTTGSESPAAATPASGAEPSSLGASKSTRTPQKAMAEADAAKPTSAVGTLPNPGGRQAALGAKQAFVRPGDSRLAAKTRREPEGGPLAAAGTGSADERSGLTRQGDRAAPKASSGPADQVAGAAKPKPAGPRRASPPAAGEELPPPTGDPEKDLGIGADMPPPGEPTPWSALPDPPRKKSP